MKQMLLVIAILFCSLTLWAGETCVYKMTRDDEVSTFEHTIEPTDTGYTITSGQSNETRESKVNFSYNATVFHYTNTLHGTDYTATRIGNKIKINGRLTNRSINKEFIINSNPWYQAIEHALQDFAASAKSNITFWFINADECEMIEMEAGKQDIDIIRVKGVLQKTLRVKVNLTGFAALFWSADYWFRQSDNRFVRYETIEGPGGPKLSIELINEDDAKP